LKGLFCFVPKPLLCVTVTAPTMTELRRRRDEATSADLVEMRLDSVADPDVAGALAGRRRPVLLTCRPEWEGGHFKGSEEQRKRFLAEACALGADFVDIEWRAHFDDLVARRGGRGVVLSAHDFAGMPEDLAGQMRAMLASGAEVVKIAATPTELSDCVPLLRLGHQHGRHGGLVLVAMGDYGLVTRVLPGRFGSRWTYAGSVSSIGQLRVATLVDDYGFHSIGDETYVYGIVGGSVAHSVSPSMHNAAFRAAGIDAVYVPMPARSADDFMTFARAIGLKGASVTIPYKVSLFEHMDDVDAAARQIGAINTIRAGDRWAGRNTDTTGFLRPLQQRVPPQQLRGMRAAVLGAGGAARAVAAALTSCGCAVRLHARNRTRAAETAALTAAHAGPWPPARGSWDLLVNCTPVGMSPRVDDTPVSVDELTGRYVYDLVYNPPATRLLREAASAGCETIGGLDMLVEQAQEQFLWWTGVKPAPGVMCAAALARLAEFRRDEDYVV
jgi:3-dehydroquinate dehydratase / shikimate dehydrogenase